MTGGIRVHTRRSCSATGREVRRHYHYVATCLAHAATDFLISQGIMSETDSIHTNVHANIPEEDDDAEGDSQYADSQYEESQYGDSQYDDSQYDGSQYAESTPPSPTESSPPGTPAWSVVSGPSTPASVHSPIMRPPHRPMTSRVSGPL